MNRRDANKDPRQGIFDMVGEVRLELTTSCEDWLLRPARIPVPPLARHACAMIQTISVPFLFQDARESEDRVVLHAARFVGRGRFRAFDRDDRFVAADRLAVLEPLRS